MIADPADVHPARVHPTDPAAIPAAPPGTEDRRRAVRELLVVDLLGGLGDLLMLLPSIHALAEHHPHARVTVLTHVPGDVLLTHDPVVAEVRTTDKGDERAAVVDALRDVRPDLTVTTTRFDGIGDLVDDDAHGRGARAVTNLWRRPPPDELVGHRYLHILATEGVVAARRADRPPAPRVVLTDAEREVGRADLVDAEWAGRGGRCDTDGARGHRDPGRGTRVPPVVLVPDAGMAVKRWPAARWSELAARLAPAHIVLSVGPVDGAHELPATDLRRLAARFAAVAERGGTVVGPDTGPVRLAAAVGARTVALFGPTVRERYGLEAATATNLQGLPGCPHRRPTAITEQVCWWDAHCPLSDEGPACLLDLDPVRVAATVAGDGAGRRPG